MKPHVRHVLLPAFVFAGAFLMFMLEPLVGRVLLPAYGGGFHVWTTCLMFFQGVLLAGYLYAHVIAPRIGRWHLLVACTPLLIFPLHVTPAPDPNAPIISIVTVLLSCIALPFGVLSTTGVLAQSWLAAAEDGKDDPYWLYAASNAGSLLGLLAYPFFVEPFLGVWAQRWTWSASYLGYLALASLVAPRKQARRIGPAATVRDAEAAAFISNVSLAAWFTLSTATSMLLMAVTNAISFDVGSIPLVWVAPLAIYLLTFVLVFSTTPTYPNWLRRYWPEAALGGLVALAAAPLLPSWPRIGLHLLALFAVCMAGHSKLHELRPHPGALTKYYLVMSIGGWAGGMFVSLAAPALFDRLLEYPIAIALVATSFALLSHTEASRDAQPVPRFRMDTVVRAPVALTALAFVSSWILAGNGSNQTHLLLLRNHYGVYQVGELTEQRTTPSGQTVVETVRQIVHNGTIHGAQIKENPGEPIGYYHRASGLGDVIDSLERPFKLGVIGLGAGASAAYLDAGDEIAFYEIDPDDEHIARRWFSYLGDCRGDARVVIGDARLTLAADPQAPDGRFDVLLVDAFSGDAIPTHLLTREAIELYLRKLRPGGLLLFHVTNRFYDLRPVLESVRRTLGLHAAYKIRPETALEPFERHSVYWVMSKDAERIDRLASAFDWSRPELGTGQIQPTTLWTDDYVNALAPLWRRLTLAEKP